MQYKTVVENMFNSSYYIIATHKYLIYLNCADIMSNVSSYCECCFLCLLTFFS